MDKILLVFYGWLWVVRYNRLWAPTFQALYRYSNQIRNVRGEQPFLLKLSFINTKGAVVSRRM